MSEKQPARFGKYSKVIRELEDTIKTLCQQMERIVAEKDAEIANLKAEIEDHKQRALHG